MAESRRRRFGAVIPAAGLSRRMGAFKPLLELDGATVIEASVGSVKPYADTAVVVVGYRGEEVEAVLRRRFSGLCVVSNTAYASSDMLASVRIGLRALGECDAFFLLPADMPLVPGAVFEALTRAFDGSDEVICPVLNGRRGHPPLIAASLIPEIAAFGGEGGLRAVFAGKRVREVTVKDGGILTDLDTPQDYQRALGDSGRTVIHPFHHD